MSGVCIAAIYKFNIFFSRILVMSELLRQMMANREVLQETKPAEKATKKDGKKEVPEVLTKKYIIEEKPSKKIVQTYMRQIVESYAEETSSDED